MKGKPAGRTPPKRYRWDLETESELLSILDGAGLSEAKRQLAKRGVHPKAVERRASKLRPRESRKREPVSPWLAEEMNHLTDLLDGIGTVDFIARRISNLNGHQPKRSQKAVRSKIARSFPHLELPGYKCVDVADLLGATVRQVRRWVANGYLESKAGRITEASVIDLLKHRGHLVNLESLTHDQHKFLVEFGYRPSDDPRAALSGGEKLADQLLRRGVNRVTDKEAATLLGVSVRSIRRSVEKRFLIRGECGIAADELLAFVEAARSRIPPLPERVWEWMRLPGSAARAVEA